MLIPFNKTGVITSKPVFKALARQLTHKVHIIPLVVVVAIVNNQKSRLILVNMEVLHWRV